MGEEYSTNVKLGVIEDHSNRTRLAKLLRFHTSNDESEQTSLADYVERMKEKQEHIFFITGSSMDEVKNSPYVERVLKKGYEVLFMVEPVDEYCIQSLPEFEGKKFQNVAKEGLKIGEETEKIKERKTALEKEYEPLLKWLKEDALKDLIEKATISDRLTQSPCALVASSYGWSGNMERIMRSQAYAKSKDPSQDFYATQKKTLELNPGHPLVKELLSRVSSDNKDKTAGDLAKVLFETATLRSGFAIKDSLDFAKRVERMLRLSMGVDVDAPVEIDDEPEEAEAVSADDGDEAEDKVEEAKAEEAKAEETEKEKESASAKASEATEDAVEGETRETPAEGKDEL